VAAHAAVQQPGTPTPPDTALDNAVLARLGAAAALVHGLAAQRASANSGGGPFTVLELCAAVPAVIAELLG
jgi:NAD(P)H-hydrate repair Nnr-like enzyme with NAD(P)H-hydrate dehydratase domain